MKHDAKSGIGYIRILLYFIVLWLQQLSQFTMHLRDKLYVNNFSIPSINFIYDPKRRIQNILKLA